MVFWCSGFSKRLARPQWSCFQRSWNSPPETQPLRVLALDDKDAEPGYNDVIDMDRAPAGRKGNVIQNGVAVFLQARAASIRRDPAFSNIAPETGR